MVENDYPMWATGGGGFQRGAVRFLHDGAGLGDRTLTETETEGSHEKNNMNTTYTKKKEKIRIKYIW